MGDNHGASHNQDQAQVSGAFHHQFSRWFLNLFTVVWFKRADGAEAAPSATQRLIFKFELIATPGGAFLSIGLSILSPGTTDIVSAAAAGSSRRNGDGVSVLTKSVAAACIHRSWRSQQYDSSGKNEREDSGVK